MSDKNKMSKPYFSHDIASRGDIKIKRLLHEQGYEGYGIYWAVVECLHENELFESDIEVLADDLRISVEKLEKVLKTDLFIWENGKVFSKRVEKNLAIQREKAEKAKRSAFIRYKKDEFTKSVITLYEKIFGKEIVLSDENRQLIKELSQKNSISLELWQKVFENAKRGWNLSDGSHKTPSLKTIFENWDSFANDDYYLAPNVRKDAQEKSAERAEKQRELDKAKQEKDKALADVVDAEAAIKYVNEICFVPDLLLSKSPIVKEFAERFGVTVTDIMMSRKKKEIA